MKEIIFKVEDEAFAVHLIEGDKEYEGIVFSIVFFTNPLADKKGWNYLSGTEGGKIYEKLNDDCRVMFTFSYCYRGIWEGRIHFKDDEYWSEELETMYRLWVKIKDYIMKKEEV